METYKLLSKIYYKNPEDYERIYSLRKNGETTIIIPVKIKENDAFYIPTSEMLNKIEKIFKNVNVISEMEYKLPRIAIGFLITKYLKDEISLTNEIEGVVSTRKEVETAINNQDSDKQARFKGLAAKYIKLIEEGAFSIESCSQIRELYDDIVLDEINNSNKPDGKIFRKEQVAVLTSTQKEKHKGVMPESNIINYMDESLHFLNDGDSNKIIRISIFHYLFGYIHPFYDGNGRLSRFLSSGLLRNEVGILLSLRLSYVIKNNINKYYEAFDICNDSKNKGDVTYFVLMFLDLLLEGTRDLIGKLRELYEKLEFYEGVIDEHFKMDSNEGLLIFILCQNALFGDSFLTISELEKILSKSSTTIRGVIDCVSNKISLNIVKQGRKHKYSINLECLDKLSETK